MYSTTLRSQENTCSLLSRRRLGDATELPEVLEPRWRAWRCQLGESHERIIVQRTRMIVRGCLVKIQGLDGRRGVRKVLNTQGRVLNALSWPCWTTSSVQGSSTRWEAELIAFFLGPISLGESDCDRIDRAVLLSLRDNRAVQGDGRRSRGQQLSSS